LRRSPGGAAVKPTACRTLRSGEAALFRRRALRATEDKDAERSERRIPRAQRARNGADQQIDRRRACAPQGDFAESALLTGASPATRRMYPRHCPDAKRPGNKRLAKLYDSFSESPESPINQACADWAETKAAYRFFRNDHVDACVIMKAHRLKTAERAKRHKTVLAIQDTSYFIYTSHPKTKGAYSD